MAIATTYVPERPPTTTPPGAAVTAVGFLMASWCVGFAAVNIVFESTNRFGHGPYAEYAAGISVVNWLVVGIKAIGAAVALRSVARRPRFVPPNIVTMFVWGAFSTLAVYALGSVVQAIGMATGLAGSRDQITLAGIGYVLFFLAAAAGYGVLAVSYARRHHARKDRVVLGLLGAPVVLGLILLVWAVLGAFGLLPPP